MTELDPEFTKMLFRVMLIGGAMALVAGGVLLLAFRAFGRQSARRATMLLAGLVGFIILCCVLLLALS
jgi:riboflavin transporter FmnP